MYTHNSWCHSYGQTGDVTSDIVYWSLRENWRRKNCILESMVELQKKQEVAFCMVQIVNLVYKEFLYWELCYTEFVICFFEKTIFLILYMPIVYLYSILACYFNIYICHQYNIIFICLDWKWIAVTVMYICTSRWMQFNALV